MLDREFMLKREDDRDKEMRCREDRRDKQVRYNHFRELLILGGLVMLIGFAGALVESGLWTPTLFDRKPDQTIFLTPTPLPPTPTQIPTQVPPTPIPDTEAEQPQQVPGDCPE